MSSELQRQIDELNKQLVDIHKSGLSKQCMQEVDERIRLQLSSFKDFMADQIKLLEAKDDTRFARFEVHTEKLIKTASTEIQVAVNQNVDTKLESFRTEESNFKKGGKAVIWLIATVLTTVISCITILDWYSKRPEQIQTKGEIQWQQEKQQVRATER